VARRRWDRGLGLENAFILSAKGVFGRVDVERGEKGRAELGAREGETE
jgi:hypothetical protein